MNIVPKEIKVHIPSDVAIKIAVESMIAMAQQHSCLVTSSHNGIIIEVVATSNAETVAERYLTLIRKKHELEEQLHSLKETKVS